MKNVLIVSTSFPVYQGDHAGLFVYELARRLASDAFRITVLAPYCPGAARKESFDGVDVYRFRYFWPFGWQRLCGRPGIMANLKNNKPLFLLAPFFLLAQLFKTISLIKKEKIDLVHAHWFFPSGLVAGLAARISGKPLVVTAHGSDIFVLRGWFWQGLRKITAGLATAVTAVSLEIGKELSAAVTPMGVDSSLFAFKNRQTFVSEKPHLVFVGRVDEAKGVGYLIRSLTAIIKEFPDARLTLIGSGYQEQEFKRLAVSLGLADRINFLGGVRNQDLPRYYQAADVFVLPSFSEGTPVSVLEAMSCGCPVVATRVGGLPALIRHREDGLLVAPRSAEQISLAVVEVLRNDSLRERIIKNARAKIEKEYDWSVAAGRFKEIYQKYA